MSHIMSFHWTGSTTIWEKYNCSRFGKQLSIILQISSFAMFSGFCPQWLFPVFRFEEMARRKRVGSNNEIIDQINAYFENVVNFIIWRSQELMKRWKTFAVEKTVFHSRKYRNFNLTSYPYCVFIAIKYRIHILNFRI